MIALIIAISLLIILFQLMTVNLINKRFQNLERNMADVINKRFQDLERNMAEVINNECTVNRKKLENRICDDGIKLENIPLEGISYCDQIRKIEEEDKEFIEAVTDGTDIEHIIEEFWDTAQARLGLLSKIYITAYDVMYRYPKHLKKLENRPRKKDK